VEFTCTRRSTTCAKGTGQGRRASLQLHCWGASRGSRRRRGPHVAGARPVEGGAVPEAVSRAVSVLKAGTRAARQSQEASRSARGPDDHRSDHRSSKSPTPMAGHIGHECHDSMPSTNATGRALRPHAPSGVFDVIADDAFLLDELPTAELTARRAARSASARTRGTSGRAIRALGAPRLPDGTARNAPPGRSTGPPTPHAFRWIRAAWPGGNARTRARPGLEGSCLPQIAPLIALCRAFSTPVDDNGIDAVTRLTHF